MVLRGEGDGDGIEKSTTPSLGEVGLDLERERLTVGPHKVVRHGGLPAVGHLSGDLLRDE